MAVISSNTFDPLRRYVGVRLQQGVPIVDADWNELDDFHKFEVQAFLKWFVGNGLPEGGNGFRIDGTGLDKDFFIRAGITGAADGLSNVGRCLVNGLDVIIAADIQFTGQALYEKNNPSPTLLAQSSGGGAILAFDSLTPSSQVVVYLDVWERLVTPAEDPRLVLPDLGTESCARLKREWVVRIRNGSTAPVPNDPEYKPGHNYYALATIARRTTETHVNPGDVTDRRERRLLIPPSTLISDVLGIDPSNYRQGQGRPAISLREAVNALLRGELPSTPDAATTPDTGVNFIKRAFFFDNTNGLVAAWRSDRFNSTDQVVVTRLDLNNITAGFATPVQQVTSGVAHSDPHAVLLSNGDLLVTYQTEDPNSSIFYKRAPLTGLNAASEQPLATAPNVPQSSPFTVVNNDLVTFFYHLNSATNPGWQYRRFQHATNKFVDTNPQPLLSTVSTATRDMHAASDGSGNIWVAFVVTGPPATISALRFTPSSGQVLPATVTTLTAPTGGNIVNEHPFVISRSNGNIHVFWRERTTSLYTAVFSGGAWQPTSAVTNTIAGDRQPCAVEDANGALWLFWTRGSSNGDIFLMRNDPVTNTWGQPRQMTFSPRDDSAPFALVAPNNAIWVFWSSDRGGNANIYYKRLVTAL